MRSAGQCASASPSQMRSIDKFILAIATQAHCAILVLVPDSKQVSRDSRRAGLCGDCVHSREVESARGSTFILCNLSLTDPRFPKYPRLPVLSCDGYKKKPWTPFFRTANSSRLKLSMSIRILISRLRKWKFRPANSIFPLSCLWMRAACGRGRTSWPSGIRATPCCSASRKAL